MQSFNSIKKQLQRSKYRLFVSHNKLYLQVFKTLWIKVNTDKKFFSYLLISAKIKIHAKCSFQIRILLLNGKLLLWALFSIFVNHFNVSATWGFTVKSHWNTQKPNSSLISQSEVNLLITLWHKNLRLIGTYFLAISLDFFYTPTRIKVLFFFFLWWRTCISENEA